MPNSIPSPSIALTHPDPVLSFAAAELARCLGRMTGLAFTILTGASSNAALRLGLFSELAPEQVSELESTFDDAIFVDVAGGRGVIAGLNPRSVLLAVYRFLTALGCRWVRPGAQGELIPRRALAECTARLAECPAFRHRAITIEGAVSLENVLELIDWAPKVGFSGYFMQFRQGHIFFDRWYAHHGHPDKAGPGISPAQAEAFTRRIEAELARRGLVYHAIGHGWTCEAFGIPGLGWDPMVQDWPTEVVQSLALVNGVRAMWQDIPLITSLCFSNPAVRRKVVDCVLAHVQSHPPIQALHFWLDDGFNNKCECPECQKRLPSDYYVILLNELDEALTGIGYPGKVVFLAYADLLWPPQTERIQHPERFILMFAPITRSYRRPLLASPPAEALPPYVRNRLVFSHDNAEQLGFLRGWQRVFQGDSFIFDYHLMQSGSYTFDPDSLFLARLIHTDVQDLKRLGLNGYVSCQLQRIFYPTGLDMHVLGRALWDDALTYPELEAEYFQAAFGAGWQEALAFLKAFATLQDLVPLKEKQLSPHPQALARLEAALEAVHRYQPLLQAHLGAAEPCQARSWFYLDFHASLLSAYLPLLAARAAGRMDEAAARWGQLKRWLWQREDDIQPVFDVWMFVEAYEREFTAGPMPGNP